MLACKVSILKTNTTTNKTYHIASHFWAHLSYLLPASVPSCWACEKSPSQHCLEESILPTMRDAYTGSEIFGCFQKEARARACAVEAAIHAMEAGEDVTCIPCLCTPYFCPSPHSLTLCYVSTEVPRCQQSYCTHLWPSYDKLENKAQQRCKVVLCHFKDRT